MGTIDIEAVVLEVVRRLLPTAAPMATPPTAPASLPSEAPVVSRTEIIVPQAPAPTAVPAPAISPVKDPAPVHSPLSTFTVPGKLVTLESLHGRLAGVTEVKVETRAIVTPAVNDELRKRGIRLSRSASVSNSISKTVASKLIVANHVSPELAKRSQHLLTSASLAYEAVEGALTPKLVDVARELAFRVTTGRKLGLFVTTQPAVASSVLQKMMGVRACLLSDTAALQEALATLAPNVLVADARKLDRQTFVSLVGQFVAAGYRDCPPELRGIL